MQVYQKDRQPKTLHEVFDFACAFLRPNVTACALDTDYEGRRTLVSSLREMGVHRAINLTRSYIEGAVAIALYTGDGIVTKVIPENYYDKANPIYQLPPISSEMVKTEDNTFVVERYPWVPKGGVTQKQIDDLHTKLKPVGIGFHHEEGAPKNVHRMPDENGTLVGIDSDMFVIESGSTADSVDLRAAWHSYIRRLYPVYDEGIPPQTENTSFGFFSIHNNNTGIAGFDATQDPAIVMVPPKPEKKSFSLAGVWRAIFGEKIDKAKSSQPSSTSQTDDPTPHVQIKFPSERSASGTETISDRSDAASKWMKVTRPAEEPAAPLPVQEMAERQAATPALEDNGPRQ